MQILLTAARAIVFGTAFVWLWGWVVLWIRRFDPLIGIQLPGWTSSLGIRAIAGGAALALSCIALFVVRGRGTPAPFDPPRSFVAVGPYTIIRNPMYVGGWLVIAGAGLVMGSSAILLFSLAWFCLVHLFVVLYEEHTLTSRFGVSYRQYRQTVPRWLPRLPTRATD